MHREIEAGCLLPTAPERKKNGRKIERRRSWWNARAGILLACASLLQAWLSEQTRAENAWSSQPTWGEYGSSMKLLQSFYTPPQSPRESNFFIDMQGGRESLRGFALAHGLTNNHALFVLCHGEAIPTPWGPRYAFYSAMRRPQNGWPAAPFSIRDIARIVGPEKARDIHNLVLASCNQENTLSPAEIRACFPNVTNLTHATPATDAQMSTFHHALLYNSRDIEFLYAMPNAFTVGVFDEKQSKHKSGRLHPYIAELYVPGARRPFRIQIAGRELLQPPRSGQVAMAKRPPMREDTLPPYLRAGD